MMRRVAAVLAVWASVACGGDAGPAGPAGPPGPAGPQGPPGPAGPSGAVNRADFSGTIGSSGGVSVTLPAASVASGRVPVIACYISNNLQTWLAVTQATDNLSWPACGLTGIGTATPSVVLVNVPIGYFYRIIVVW